MPDLNLRAAAEAAAEQRGQLDELRHTARYNDRVGQLRAQATRQLGKVLCDVADVLDGHPEDVARQLVDHWTPTDRDDQNLPRALYGRADDVPLAARWDGNTYEAVLTVGAPVDLGDGVRLLVTSSPLHYLADLPDRLVEFEQNVEAEEQLAMAREALADDYADDDPVDTVQLEADLAEAMRRMDLDALRTVAAYDVQTAASVLAPLVMARALDRIAYRMES